jgi:trehalose 6-phosphate phosphatase
MTPPVLTAQHALFLDIDGTLIDIAPTPDDVVVPPNLPPRLRELAQQRDGALAILSGRKLADIDFLLRPGLPCAAEHGMILRDIEGVVTPLVQRPAHYEHWLKIFNRYAEAMPGILVEQKDFSLVLHYRRAPAHEAELRSLVERLVSESDDTVLLLAHCAFAARRKLWRAS